MDKLISDLKAQEFYQLWDIHRSADWPSGFGVCEGELMTIDTVLGGCVTFFIEEKVLDAPRVVILQDCLNELAVLLEKLEIETKGYFDRLQTLGQLLLEITPSS